MHFAMQIPAIGQQLYTNKSWCILTIRSELFLVGGLGVGLGVINMALPAGIGALATRRFIAQACLTAGGTCSATSAGMIPWDCRNAETPIRRLQLPSRFGHTSGSVSEHEGDVGPVT